MSTTAVTLRPNGNPVGNVMKPQIEKSLFFERFLLATGETEVCKKAAALARAIAQRYKSELIVAEALPSYPMDPIRAQKNIQHALDGLQKWTSQMRLDKFIAERTVMRDEPGPAISQLVRFRDPSFILLGTHAARGFERWLLGSVAEEMARGLAIPSLIVGSRCFPRYEKFAKFQRVLFATDLSEVSFGAVKVIHELQCATVAELYVLHCLPTQADPFLRYRRRQDAGAFLKDRLQTLNVAVTAIEEGKPHDLVARFAEEFDVDALVLGIRSGSDFTRAATHLRSLTSKIVAKAPCPVFTLATKTAARQR